MPPFTYLRPATWDEATAALAGEGARALGGGTDLIPLTRQALAAPERVVDLRGIPGAGRLEWGPEGELSIGAATTLRQLAADPRLQSVYPALARACASVGSYALRHMGTLGGNLCQRMRCWYFRNGHACLRTGGSLCSAEVGENQYHAVFRQGPCVAVHPSDPAVALVALEARVRVVGPGGSREVAAADFLAPSRVRLDSETVLGPGEVVAGVRVPAESSGGVQVFEKSMQRAAWDFALVSLAGVRRRDGAVRLVLGGVANTPWRISASVEEDVASGGLGEDDIDILAQRALYDAEPLAKNAYKLDIAAALLGRAMRTLATGP